jgi:hypothetical protein
MLKKLKDATDALPALLNYPDQWHSLDIDYHSPRVQRIWTTWEGHRILLHKISPCGPGEALLHPHPWPSAMVVMRGQYEHGIGYSAGLETPPVVCRSIIGQGACYEMTDPNAWHYVRPLVETYTIMVTGKPWDRQNPSTVEEGRKTLKPLDSEDAEDLLFTFKYHLDRWPVRIPNI